MPRYALSIRVEYTADDDGESRGIAADLELEIEASLPGDSTVKVYEPETQTPPKREHA